MRYPADWHLMTKEEKEDWLETVQSVRNRFNDHIITGNPIYKSSYKKPKKSLSGDLKFFQSSLERLEKNKA